METIPGRVFEHNFCVFTDSLHLVCRPTNSDRYQRLGEASVGSYSPEYGFFSRAYHWDVQPSQRHLFSDGEHFSREALGWLLLYEYRKDVLTYILIMLGIYAYREIKRQRLGEAQLAEPGTNNSEESILVSKRGLFHFIKPASIHWVEAAGNYVELHAGVETYMLRSTMKEIDKRLGQDDFVRIHRSTIVNRGEIKRIEPARNGDSVLVLKGDEKFRFSRRYRQNLAAN